MNLKIAVLNSLLSVQFLFFSLEDVKTGIQIGSEKIQIPDGCELHVVPEQDAIRASQQFKPPVDFVYMGSYQDYCCFYSRLKHWYPFVKGHGILAGGWSPELIEVLHRFAGEENLTVETGGGYWVLRKTKKPHPIQFSIPEEKIVKEIPEKDRDFAFIHPDFRETYIYEMEEEYYQDYQRSYFAITRKKGGWDCLRHYEILANGCIPYFLGLDECDDDTMHFLPKDLIKKAMELPGVSYLKIDHEIFDRAQYDQILTELLDYTRNTLSCRQMAAYLLETLQYSGVGKVLFLTGSTGPDYLRCLTLIGLKQLLGQNLVDALKPPHIYKSYCGEVRQLYGKGMTYSKVVDDLPVDRENIDERIKDREFELIIYGSIHRGLPFYHTVLEHYDSSKIAYICGEDLHRCQYGHLNHFFMREFESYNTHDPQLPVYD